MPGEPLPTPPVHCPVRRVEITPCDAAELAPLLGHLSTNQPLQAREQFARGTLLGDGRLDLCKQSLGMDNCLQLTTALQHNTHVRSLMLGTDAIGDVGAGAVAHLLGANAHLEVLYLGCNNIGPEGAQALGTALAGSTQVTGLWLKRNPLGPEGAAHIAHMLRSNRHLRVLDLVNTDVRDEGVHALVDALCTDNRSLRSLYLSGNGLGPSAATDLARLLREAPQVEALYLSVNRFDDDGATVLAEALHANATLQTLELASNDIGPEGGKALFAAVKRHPCLQTLNLGYAPSSKVLGSQANHLGDPGAADAAELLAAVPALRKLDLTRNGITSVGALRLSEAMQANGRLGTLLLEGPLPEALVVRLARNRIDQGVLPAPVDQTMIKSVYR